MTIDINFVNDTTTITVNDTPTIVDITNVNEVIDIVNDNIIVEFAGDSITNVDLTIDEQTLNLTSDNINVTFDGIGAQGNTGTGFIQIYTLETDAPRTPTDGSYNFDTNTLTVPAGWYISPPTLTSGNKLWGSFTTLEEKKPLSWAKPFILSVEGASVSGVTSFRAEPVKDADIGLIWARRFTYSQNLRVGNSTNSTWLEIVPGIGTVELSSLGTDLERSNYLKINANVNSTNSRNLVDQINSNNIGRKL